MGDVKPINSKNQEAKVFNFPSQLETPVEQPDVRSVNKGLEWVGEKFTKKENRGKRTVEQLRHKGAFVASVVGIGLAGMLGPIVKNEVNYMTGTDVPASTQNLDPNKYEVVTVPAGPGGAAALAHEVDPDHDPNNGAMQMHEQLGHSPHGGELVAVPKPAQ
jgi:hypothetical protein